MRDRNIPLTRENYLTMVGVPEEHWNTAETEETLPRIFQRSE
jgi:hypothetical protein